MKRSYSSLSSSSNSSSSPSQSSINSNAANGGSRGGPTTTRVPPLQPQCQQPVIIYMHSPRVIHTHPRDFMALVQKLTGLYRPEEDHEAHGPAQPKSEDGGKKRTQIGANNNNSSSYNSNNDDTESLSVITEEENNSGKNNNNSISIGDQYGQMITSDFVPPNSYESPSTYMTGLSMFNPNVTAFLCSDHSNFYGHYGDRLLLAPTNEEPQFHQAPLWRS